MTMQMAQAKKVSAEKVSMGGDSKEENVDISENNNNTTETKIETVDNSTDSSGSTTTTTSTSSTTTNDTSTHSSDTYNGNSIKTGDLGGGSKVIAPQTTQTFSGSGAITNNPTNTYS